MVGERHPWHTRTVDLAKQYRALATGDGLDSLLRQYVERESEEAFKQRVKYTQHICTSVVGNLASTLTKVPRSNYQRILLSTDTATAEGLEATISTFYAGGSLDDYVKTRWLEMNTTDPNAWVVVEFEPFDNTKQRAAPYPFEVSSANAVDFTLENGVVSSLTAQSKVAFPPKDGQERSGTRFTAYLANQTVTLTELPPEEASALSGWKDKTYNGNYFRAGSTVYRLDFPVPHNAGFVPACRVGFSRDLYTDGHTYVAPYHNAIPLILKSIKVNSELDLTMGKSAFPFRLEYAPPCDAPGCISGYLADGSECGTCNGSGHKKTVTSAQERFVLPLPKAKADVFDLDNLLIFKSPPVEILEFQRKYIDDLTAACKAAMFNSDIFTKQQVSDTATGKRIDLESVYDTLFSCALGMGAFWKFLVTACATFTEQAKGLNAELRFSKDFKLKGLNDLLLDLESANRSGVSPDVRRSIQADINRLIFSEAPRELAKTTIKERFNPFSGFTEDMVQVALSDPYVPEPYKLRYLMLGVLFDEIEAEFGAGDVYSQPIEKIKALIDAKVGAWIGQTRPQIGVNGATA